MLEYTNETTLIDMRVDVARDSCSGAVTVNFFHAKPHHTLSVFQSADAGDTWTLVHAVPLSGPSPPPPPSPSPPPPSPSPPPPSPPFSVVQLGRRLQEAIVDWTDASSPRKSVRVSGFSVPLAYTYVRACIDCDGGCNGLDHLDAIVSCSYAAPPQNVSAVAAGGAGALSPPPAPPPPPAATSSAAWMWVAIVLGVALLAAVGCALGAMRARRAATAPTPPRVRVRVR
jgi:hypothetical protein